MKENSLVILCLRLMGIYIGALGLNQVSGVLPMVLKSRSLISYSFSLGGVILVFSGVLLIIYAAKLSRFMTRSGELEESISHISASARTTRIALAILGVFIFAESLPQFVQKSIIVGLYYATVDEVPRYMRYGPYAHTWTNLIVPIVRLIISAILIIGPDRVIGFIAQHDQTFRKLKSSDDIDETDVDHPGA